MGTVRAEQFFPAYLFYSVRETQVENTLQELPHCPRLHVAALVGDRVLQPGDVRPISQ